MKGTLSSITASVVRLFLCIGLLGLLSLGSGTALSQTADDVTELIGRLIELDSIDISTVVKFRSGLEPSLHAFDADETKMAVLKNPYEAQGQGKPSAAGWYRVSFVVPEKLGKFAIPKTGYNLGVESNVLGSWEIYTYKNGQPAGAAMAPTATGVWSKGNVMAMSHQPPTAWVSNAPMPTKPGDKITIAILATAAPLGGGSPEGFALRHLRLRFALAHTGARQPFYAALNATREKLRALKDGELTAFQAKLKEPLARLELVFKAAEAGQLDNLTKAMLAASKDFNEALKK